MIIRWCKFCGRRRKPEAKDPCPCRNNPKLQRILDEQAATAKLLHAGHPDQRGLRQASEDLLMEEALIREEQRNA